MQELDKQTIFTSLKKCEAIVQENLKTIGEPSEAELRSINNERLAVELLTFSTFVADVGHMYQTEKDHVEQYYEYRKLELITGVKADPVEGQSVDTVKWIVPPMAVNKAESTVKTEIEYIGKLDKLRDIKKSWDVLKRKEESLERILDQSRSRLSLVSRSIPS